MEQEGESKALAMGNDGADTEAKEGRSLHPKPTDAQTKSFKKACWHATIACRLNAATLPLWPKLLPRHQRGEDGTRSRGLPNTVSPELNMYGLRDVMASTAATASNLPSRESRATNKSGNAAVAGPTA